jgi:lysophospholipase L1-like esterase
MPTPAELLSIYTGQSEISSFFIDKMGLISVKSYGAVGDGVTDDTVAITAAKTAATAAGLKGLFFPHGVYKVDAATSFTGFFLWGDNSSFSGIADTITQVGDFVTGTAFNSHTADNSIHGKTFHASRFISKLQNGESATVVFLGDSTTELNATTEGSPNHVGLLETWLDSLYPGLVTVVNAGVSGNSIIQMWRRVYKDVLSQTPDLIVICSGINDYGGTNAITLQEYIDNYNMIIREILSHLECDIIIRTPNPVISSAFNAGMEDFNDASEVISKKYNLGFFDLYTEMSGDIADGTIVQADLMYDSIHPNADGHEYIYEKFQDYFTPTGTVEKPVNSYKMINGLDGLIPRNTGASETSNTNYMNGTVLSWNTTSRYIETEFIGSDFSVVYTAGASCGQFIVYIDDIAQTLVDTYAASTTYRSFVSYSVASGKHKIKIENQATKNASSSGYNINIEGLIFLRENTANADIIQPYEYALVKQTGTVTLTPGVASTFIFNSVTDNADIINQNIGTGVITIKKAGLYSLRFTSRITTDPDSLIVLAYNKNTVTQVSTFRNLSDSTGAKTETIDLIDTAEFAANDELLFTIAAGGTAPATVAATTFLTITKIK